MLNPGYLSFLRAVDLLKALGESTRLRLVRLLAENDLTVSDLVSILGQSQPRISRHLKLLVESGILTRYQEGAWAYFRLAENEPAASSVRAFLGGVSADDPILSRDAERLEAVRSQRAERAMRYFAENAVGWDRIRSLHVPDAEVETTLLQLLGEERIDTVLDVGTGTGRMLELLAPKARRRAVGIDASREMLAVARAKIDAGSIANVSFRLGDAYHLPVEPAGFDLVTLHQVLHYLDDPAKAVREAASVLAPGGRLAIVDFAPHDHEFLRESFAHLRLGFSRQAIEGFLDAAGLDVETTQLLEPPAGGPADLTVTISIGRARHAPAIAVLRA